ncbi:MAG: sigma-70 family RNA polymerase sigma factor [Planctomycetes bacterium]|nr:sigma-70 family RNA polymerase sigma factor [Planctomycetota bacterium]MCB9884313.1 sigma-70 family RNA polymerase sigma factor [Planctomycetota bacterium]
MRTLEAGLAPPAHEPARPAGERTVADAADAPLVHRHVAGVFRFARSLGATRDEAEDLTQEAFVVAWRKGKQRLEDRALAAFLRRAVRLLWLEHRRDARRAEAAISALTLQLWEREIEDDGSLRIEATRDCMRQLQGRAARAIDLAYRDGASRVEIAAALGMLPNGVKTLLARTRAWLEQCIRRNQ